MLGFALAWLVRSSLSSSRVSFLNEAVQAELVIREVSVALSRCKSQLGYYVELEQLGSFGCGGVKWLKSGKSKAGFRVELQLRPESYTITLSPEFGKGRLLAYVSDERGNFSVQPGRTPAATSRE